MHSNKALPALTAAIISASLLFAGCAHESARRDFIVRLPKPPAAPLGHRVGVLLFSDRRENPGAKGLESPLKLTAGDADFVVDPLVMVRSKIADGLASSLLFTEVKALPFATSTSPASSTAAIGASHGVDLILTGEVTSLDGEVRRTQRVGSCMGLFCLSWASDFMPSAVTAQVALENVSLVETATGREIWKWRVKSLTEEETSGWSKSVPAAAVTRCLEQAVQSMAEDIQRAAPSFR